MPVILSFARKILAICPKGLNSSCKSVSWAFSERLDTRMAAVSSLLLSGIMSPPDTLAWASDIPPAPRLLGGTYLFPPPAPPGAGAAAAGAAPGAASASSTGPDRAQGVLVWALGGPMVLFADPALHDPSLAG